MSYQLIYGDYDLLNQKVEKKAKTFYFKKHNQMIDFIDQNCFNKKGSCVWLCYKFDIKEIFISDNHLRIQSFFEKMPLWKTVGGYWLQEFKNLEDAYLMAIKINKSDDNTINIDNL